MTTHGVLLLLALAARLQAQQTPGDSTWRDHDRAGRAARNARDFASAQRHYMVMDSLLGGHPSTAQAIARMSILAGDTAFAVAELQRLQRMGVSFDVAGDSVLRALGPSLAGGFRRNGTRVGDVGAFAVLPDSDYMAEGVAYDPVGKDVLSSSIRNGTVARIAADGTARAFVDITRDGGWSALGLAVDASRGRLWVSSFWYPHGVRAQKSDSLRSGVFLYDLASGAFRRRFEIPAGVHAPGDICVAPNGDLYSSDSRDGSIRVIRNGSDSLSAFVRAGVLVSPQGCAVDHTTGRLFVADYVLGIMSVDLATGAVHALAKSRDVAVNGIDGLVMAGASLIGVQNGVNLPRVVLMTLDDSRSEIRSVCTLARDPVLITDPTHLTIVGRDIVFVENSGFDSYDDAGALKKGETARAPRLGRISLAAGCAP